MPPTLKIQEATVQTVQVEIKVLKVGKKQVTMGLFRQLPRGVLLDPRTVQLQGLPWGHVNYWWDGDGAEEWRRSHKLHVVWQAGEELRRAVVYEDPDTGMLGRFRGQILRLNTDLFLLRLQARASFPGLDVHHGREQYDVSLDGHRMTIALESPAVMAVNHYCAWQSVDVPQKAAREATEAVTNETARRQRIGREVSYPMPTFESEYQRLLAHQTAQQQTARAHFAALLRAREIAETSPGAIEQRLLAVTHSEADYRQRWQKQWQALCELPQLFIAV